MSFGSKRISKTDRVVSEWHTTGPRFFSSFLEASGKGERPRSGPEVAPEGNYDAIVFLHLAYLAYLVYKYCILDPNLQSSAENRIKYSKTKIYSCATQFYTLWIEWDIGNRWR